MKKELTEKQKIAKQNAKEKALYNLFKKITKEKNLDSRPILKNIALLDNGVAVATDSHRLLRATSFHNNEETVLINGQTKERFIPDYQQYPDTNRLIPFFDRKAIINVKETYELLRTLMKENNFGMVKKKYAVLNLAIKDGILTLKPTFDFEEIKECSIELVESTHDFETNLNPKFLLEGLLMFKQAKIEEVSLNFLDSEIRPFTLESDDITYLITPIRTY